MSTVILTLQLPDPDLRRAQIVAATRDPFALLAFRRAIIRDYERRLALATSERGRLLAEKNLHEVKSKLRLLLADLSMEESER